MEGKGKEITITIEGWMDEQVIIKTGQFVLVTDIPEEEETSQLMARGTLQFRVVAAEHIKESISNLVEKAID